MGHIPERPTIARDGAVVDLNELPDDAKFRRRLHDAVIRVYVKESTRRSVRRRAAVHLPNR
jgi:hypothetical protein